MKADKTDPNRGLKKILKALLVVAIIQSLFITIIFFGDNETQDTANLEETKIIDAYNMDELVTYKDLLTTHSEHLDAIRSSEQLINVNPNTTLEDIQNNLKIVLDNAHNEGLSDEGNIDTLNRYAQYIYMNADLSMYGRILKEETENAIIDRLGEITKTHESREQNKEEGLYLSSILYAKYAPIEDTNIGEKKASSSKSMKQGFINIIRDM